MELKTKIQVEDGRQDLLIIREFDLPLELLFRAYEVPEIVEQWMNTKVLKLENKQHGSYQLETSTPDGDVVFRANGVIHEFKQNVRIVRTFEMENTQFEIQLEFLDFEMITNNKSVLKMHIIYRSNEMRDAMLKLPFAQGLNMAHNQLQEIASKY